MDVEENEISLLDMLVVMAENIKLLIIGPIVVGLLALGITFVLPQSYVSQAILSLPISAATTTPTQVTTQAAAMMVSPLVLDPVIASLQLSAGDSPEVARTRLTNQVKAIAGKDGLLRMEVTARTPEQAQTLANAVIDSWLKSTVPSEQNRADMEKRLIYARESLKSVRNLLDRLVSEEGGGLLSKTLTRGEAGMSIAALAEMQTRYLSEVLTIPRQLKGLLRDDVVTQLPTLPTVPTSPKKCLTAILAALGAAFALLLWVFMRQAWRNAAQDQQVAEKQARLRAALGLK